MSREEYSSGQPQGQPRGNRPLETATKMSLSQMARAINEQPVQWDRLAKRPFFVPKSFEKSDVYRGLLAFTLFRAQFQAQRRVTPEEAHILLEQRSKYIYTLWYAVPTIFATATVYTVRGRDQFKFPFYTPGEKFRSNVFPTKNTAWLRGIYARTMWHSCRFVAYLAVSQWAISAFFVSYAGTVQQASFDQDARLNSLRKSMQTANVERKAAAEAGLRKQPMSSQPNSQRSPQQTEDQRYQNEQQQYQQEYQPPSQQRYPTQYRQPQAASNAPSQSTRDYDDGLGPNDYDDFTAHDDASPVAPAQQQRRWQKPGATPGSSWDRLRKQAATGQAPQDERDVPPQGNTWSRLRESASPDADKGDKTAGDYMYNLRDEEKSFAKDKAQRGFDAMLDKERQGENDGDSRRRW